jgi:RHS repeat-associated protein
LGRRVAAIYNRNDTTTLADDFVEFYGYDQSWRLTTVWRQAAVGANGGTGRPAPVIYERFLHNPGWGSRLDAPLMSQVNDNWDQVDELGDPIAPVWDGPDAHRRTFIQDTFGNVIAVRDNTLVRTTVRISYSPTGEPVLDSYYSGADFDRNGGVDAGDLAAFLAAFQEGDETADMDQNGGVDGGDLDLFLQWHEAGFAGDHTLDAQRFLYRGYHWDDTLKMYHVRHRIYDPARMLWIQRDPLGRIPGANEYAYCLGEPVDFYDPMGLEGEGGAESSDGSGSRDPWVVRALRWMFLGYGSEKVRKSVEDGRRQAADLAADGDGGSADHAIQQRAMDLSRLQSEGFPQAADMAFWHVIDLVSGGGSISGGIGAADDIAKGLAHALEHADDAKDLLKAGAAIFVRGKKVATRESGDIVTVVGIYGKNGEKLHYLALIRDGKAVELIKKLPEQTHHLMSDKCKWTEKFAGYVEKYGLDLNKGDWNKVRIPHDGPHAPEYHEWVDRTVQQIMKEAGNDRELFLKLYDEKVKKVVEANPAMVQPAYYER